jgi:hypothetical protein
MSQRQRLYEMLSDMQPHSNFEIHEKTGMLQYPVRIFELKQELLPKGYEIKGWHCKEVKNRYWYQLVKTQKEHQLTLA